MPDGATPTTCRVGETVGCVKLVENGPDLEVYIDTKTKAYWVMDSTGPKYLVYA
jgi:hypothetical protein